MELGGKAGTEKGPDVFFAFCLPFRIFPRFSGRSFNRSAPFLLFSLSHSRNSSFFYILPYYFIYFPPSKKKKKGK